MALSTFALNSFECQNLHMSFGTPANVAPRGANNKEAQTAKRRLVSDWYCRGNTIGAQRQVTSIVPPPARQLLGQKFHPLSARRYCGKGSL